MRPLGLTYARSFRGSPNICVVRRTKRLTRKGICSAPAPITGAPDEFWCSPGYNSCSISIGNILVLYFIRRQINHYMDKTWTKIRRGYSRKDSTVNWQTMRLAGHEDWRSVRKIFRLSLPIGCVHRCTACADDAGPPTGQPAVGRSHDQGD